MTETATRRGTAGKAARAGKAVPIETTCDPCKRNRLPRDRLGFRSVDIGVHMQKIIAAAAASVSSQPVVAQPAFRDRHFRSAA